MEIMIPVWQDASDMQLAASSVHSLKGSTIALVDDNYDAVFTDELEKQLREAYGAIVKRFVKPWGSAPSPQSLIDEAAQCNLAVVGIGL
ncbi:MAG: hypothetical protein V4787_02635 [Pseudomonadota bacterium]